MKRTLSLLDKLILLHSGFSIQFGWVFIIVGSLFSAVFVPMAFMMPEARFAVFVLIFPIVGAGIAFFGYKNNFQSVELLEVGVLTKGEVLGSEFTGSTIKINNTTYPVLKYTIAFGNEAGEAYTIEDTTHLPVYQDTEGKVPVIYPRQAPSDGILFSAISGAPELLPDGDFKPFPLYRAINLVMPLGFTLLVSAGLLMLIKGLILRLLH